MSRIVLAATMLAILAIPPPAAATICEGVEPCMLVEVATPLGVYYLDDRGIALGNGLWIYQESNGIYAAGAPAHDNLQRGGCSSLFPSQCELHWDEEHHVPDSLVYG